MKTKTKTNEQEIKELEIELKNVNEQLDEFTALREQFNMMHGAGDICSDLNIQVDYIESEISQIKSLGMPKKEVGSMIEDIEIKSSCIAPDISEPYTRDELMGLDKSDLAEMVLVRQRPPVEPWPDIPLEIREPTDPQEDYVMFDGSTDPHEIELREWYKEQCQIKKKWEPFHPEIVIKKLLEIHQEDFLMLREQVAKRYSSFTMTKMHLDKLLNENFNQ